MVLIFRFGSLINLIRLIQKQIPRKSCNIHAYLVKKKKVIEHNYPYK